jgi:hypothetical protein
MFQSREKQHTMRNDIFFSYPEKQPTLLQWIIYENKFDIVLNTSVFNETKKKVENIYNHNFILKRSDYV